MSIDYLMPRFRFRFTLIFTGHSFSSNGLHTSYAYRGRRPQVITHHSERHCRAADGFDGAATAHHRRRQATPRWVYWYNHFNAFANTCGQCTASLTWDSLISGWILYILRAFHDLYYCSYSLTRHSTLPHSAFASNLYRTQHRRLILSPFIISDFRQYRVRNHRASSLQQHSGHFTIIIHAALILDFSLISPIKWIHEPNATCYLKYYSW
jgi:hypothetical protein